MKPLSTLQKQNLSEVKNWLQGEVAAKKVVYMNECPVDTKHIPFRALRSAVVEINKNESIPYLIGGDDSQNPVSTMVVYQQGIEW